MAKENEFKEKNGRKPSGPVSCSTASAKPTKCRACGETLYRAMLIAMLIAAGAQTQDPNYCPATQFHEHEWSND